MENGGCPLQVVRAGQDSSAHQVFNLAFTGQKEVKKIGSCGPLGIVFCAFSVQSLPGACCRVRQDSPEE